MKETAVGLLTRFCREGVNKGSENLIEKLAFGKPTHLIIGYQCKQPD